MDVIGYCGEFVKNPVPNLHPSSEIPEGYACFPFLNLLNCDATW